MKRVAFILMIAVTLMAISQYSPRNADAQTIPYTFEYNATNFYNGATLVYEFPALDNTQVYNWGLFTADPVTGNPLSYLGFRSLSFVASGTIQFTQEFWPENYTGPIVVRDLLRQATLGRHFVSRIVPAPWFSSSGNTALNDKQAPGPLITTGDCRSAPYQPINVSGWSHSGVPCASLTQVGGYGLLHYQIDPTYVGPSDIAIRFFNVPNSTAVLTIDIDDIIAYQVTSGYSLGFQIEAAYSFMVVNTTGNPLPFVDNVVGNAAFTSSSSFNPLRAEFAPGAYNCRRDDIVAVTWISDCETVWLVSEDGAGLEWQIIPLDEVGENGTQTLTNTSKTLGIWDSYHGIMAATDVANGFTDSTVYSFALSRTYTYPITAGALEDVEVTWITAPSGIFSGLMTTLEAFFEVTNTYDIVEVVTYEELIQTLLTRWGLDTDLGKNFLFVIVMTVALMIPAIFGLMRKSPVPYTILWIATGGLLLFAKIVTDLTLILWILMSLVLAVLSITKPNFDAEESI